MIRLTLNASHRNTLLAALKYCDRLLGEALAGLRPAEDGAVFAAVHPDATPTQRQVAGDQIARFRRALRDALETCSLPPRPSEVSAVWALRTALVSVEIALEDVSARHLRGYGAIDEETANGVAVLQAELRAAVVDLHAYLSSGLGGDLSARIARLDQTQNEVRLLRELERIVTAHGLVELRPQVKLLMERLEKNEWTVAFVGRVSCGKSSLLNYLLGTDALPSGVTPVTAVPIRIGSGPDATATVSFAPGKPLRVPAAQLREFASEEHNPGNARHVTDIVLVLPAPRLAGDVCFVDTPGLGSLATAGAAQTLAFLPRCDLGVFLLDAATAPGGEDLAVLRSLLEGGAEVLVAISKADLLSSADRDKVVAYVRRHLASAFGREIPVAPVSVSPATPHSRMRGSPMRSRRARPDTANSRRRRCAARSAHCARRCWRRSIVVPATSSGNFPPLSPAKWVRRARRSNAPAEGFTISSSNPCRAPRSCWLRPPTLWRRWARARPKPSFPPGSQRHSQNLPPSLAELSSTLLRETRKILLRALGGEDDPNAATLPAPFSRPLFDPAPLIGVRFSVRWQQLPLAARRVGLRRQLRGLVPAFDEALREHARTLVHWSEHYLDELGAQFEAQAGFTEAITHAEPVNGAAVSAELRRDLDNLRHWNTSAREAAP